MEQMQLKIKSYLAAVHCNCIKYILYTKFTLICIFMSLESVMLIQDYRAPSSAESWPETVGKFLCDTFVINSIHSIGNSSDGTPNTEQECRSNIHP